MSEFEIFMEAVHVTDRAQRVTFLDKACQANRDVSPADRQPGPQHR